MERKRVKSLLTLVSLGLLVLAGCVSIPKVELITPSGEAGLPVDVELSWRLSNAFVTGEVHLYISQWKSEVENKTVDPLVLDLSRSSIRAGTDIPPLEWDTTYYWMVVLVEKDVKGSVLEEFSSEIAQFTTAVEPKVVLNSPTGGTVGATAQVRWAVEGALPESATTTFEILVGESEDALEVREVVAYEPDDVYQEEVDFSEYDGEDIYIAVRTKEVFSHGEVLSQTSDLVNVDVDTFGDVGLSPFYPEDGNVVSEVDPELTWRINRKPSNYRVRVYVDENRDELGPGATWILESEGESAKLGDNEAPLQWNTFYYWQVALERLDESGSVVKTYYGGPWSFYTPLKPSVSLISPVGISVDATQTEFQWHLSKDIGDGWHELYLGEYTTTMSRRALVDNVSGQLGYSTTLDLGSYAGKTLYWKIVTVDIINESYSYEYESPVASFMVNP